MGTFGGLEDKNKGSVAEIWVRLRLGLAKEAMFMCWEVFRDSL